ncbi:MAG TPA: bifunctional phosphopantothenoylcysteine decarboxylase/phosphopantothenate--cysteine ligase CoaBC [Methanomassiliicoccales archaeon]|nr:bifunctional phosphopantothenoylcysteine decarboxylase/phosphopantothenate--cysteine ligase CoaBC [Methanomassiliicoccales archaeon]
MHPSDAIIGSQSSLLKGKKIVLGITGSIAAVECFELARDLMRHGATVIPVLTPEAQKLVTPYAMSFATGQEAITELDGRVQHVSLMGDVKERADLLLIAPSTANTISKIACGIDDTTVTTMATVALGSGVPVLIAPAMHGAMFNNPMVAENIVKLKKAGVEFIGPRMEGKKAKIAVKEEIVHAVIRKLSAGKMKGKRLLIIGGSSAESMDDMRIVTNRGTGETAIELAKAAYHEGADVELWMGRCTAPLPSFVPIKRFESLADLEKMIDDIDHDMVIVPAALSDFTFDRKRGKLPSEAKATKLQLKSVPKMLPLIVRKCDKVVGFKAESGVKKEELVKEAIESLNRNLLSAVVANDLKDVKAGSTKVIFVRARYQAEIEGTKSEVARRLIEEMSQI